MIFAFRQLLVLISVLLQVQQSYANTKRQNNACSFATTTVSDFSDATAITACSTLTGDVVIATNTGRDGEKADFVMNGPSEIKGSLIAKDANDLLSISSNTLQTITGSLMLENTQILTELNLTGLQSVDTVELSGLPNMQFFSLLQTLEQVDTISIQNALISELEGFSMQSVNTLILANNPYLNSVNLQPYNVTGSLSVEANGADLDLSMPNVEIAQNLTFRNVSSLNIPRLTTVHGELGLYSNSISSLDGMPSVQSIDGGLVIYGNDALQNMSLTLLQSIGGGLRVVNNSALTTIDNLYGLTTITGDVEVSGEFSEITFPALTALKGSLNITSDNAMSCNPFDDLYSNDVIKQHYYCRTANDTGVSHRLRPANASASRSTSTNTGTSSPSAGTGESSSAVKVGVGVGVGVGGALAIAGALWFFLRRRKIAKHPQSPRAAEVDGSEVDRAAMIDGGDKHELQQPTGELPSGVQAQELPAAHGESELSRQGSRKSPDGLHSQHELPSNEKSP